MNNPIVKLRQWFEDLYSEFGNDAPSPNRFKKIVKIVIDALNATPTKYLGAGDNGIAFLADDGDIIKFTIDKNEALLWHRLKSKTQTGITHLKDIYNLSSSKTGDSIVYVLKAEFAPHPVSRKQSELIRAGVIEARENTQADLRKMGIQRDKDLYMTRRTINMVKQFQKISEVDPNFSEIPELLMDLADKHGGHIYDLQPDNFRRKSTGQVILVDPSVPDLVGDIHNPQDLMYEDKVELALFTRRIFID